MPWKPVLDQDRWYKTIQAVSETLKKTQDQFSDEDWGFVSEKYALDGGRFKIIPIPSQEDKDARVGKDEFKKVSGLMVSDIQQDLEAQAKRLEETTGKAAADFTRCLRLVETSVPNQRRTTRSTPSVTPTAPQLVETPTDDVRRSMKALMNVKTDTNRVAVEATVKEVQEEQKEMIKEAPVTKKKKLSVAKSIQEAASGEDIEATARKLLESVLHR